METTINAARVRISGRVQGVFFRASVLEEAQRLGLKGWVRNLPTGEVEAHFEGPRMRIEDIIDWCRLGPPQAKVESVDTDWVEPEEFGSFEVRQ